MFQISRISFFYTLFLNCHIVVVKPSRGESSKLPSSQEAIIRNLTFLGNYAVKRTNRSNKLAGLMEYFENTGWRVEVLDPATPPPSAAVGTMD